MEKKNFAEQENLCLFRFAEAGSCFHVCSQENHPVLFHNEEEFKAAMNVVAFVAFLFRDIRKLSFRSYLISDLNGLRNVIAYVNRNGAVVFPNENVFTYEWGANRYFFNREARLRYRDCGHFPTIREKREIFRSNLLAGESKITTLDGIVSPMSYCHIAEAESFFRNSRNYFYCISRNVEASKEIAKELHFDYNAGNKQISRLLKMEMPIISALFPE